MARPLAGRTALVTGAGKRIGRAIALALTNEGVHIVAHFNQSQEGAESLVQQCDRLGARGYCLAADLSSPDEASALPARALELAGALDIVVNNASIFPSDSLHDFSAESLDANVRMNALAPALVTRAFADQCGTGDIVNLLDARMFGVDKAHLSYHLSKRMLYAFTRLMALEYAPEIRVNAVAPGLVLPPAGRDLSYLKSLQHTNPLHTYGSPEDVAEATVFLLKTGFTTGQVIFVDGGRHMIGGIYG